MFSVYHAKDPDFQDNGTKHFPQDFELVARVDATTLKEVFRMTNHIDKPWWKNTKVKAIKYSRSTSVGDVVVDQNGTAFLCKKCGWEKL